MAMNAPAKPALTETGQLGIWVIAVYWFTRSGAVIGAWALARANPGAAQQSATLIHGIAPFIWMFHVTPVQCLLLAPASAIIGFSAAIGVLLRQKWSLAIIAFDRVFPFLRFVVFLPLLMHIDQGAMSSINGSPLKLFDLAFTAFTAFYLFQPDVRRSFGFS